MVSQDGLKGQRLQSTSVYAGNTDYLVSTWWMDLKKWKQLTTRRNWNKHMTYVPISKIKVTDLGLF